MSMTSAEYRGLAAADRLAATATALPQVRERLLRSADRWDAMADRQLTMEQNRQSQGTVPSR